ncbi:extracellular solute-binding protein [Paenibacillus sp. HB172176]|uniref:extracellular solute-binding protein n=1 Tax=Paenibacillus sp. HB172176 TaxID=2493690 RepID=UPI00143B2B08|nr:extracellular solute-binding protein [Paenibacillus sp. HB172176]
MKTKKGKKQALSLFVIASIIATTAACGSSGNNNSGSQTGNGTESNSNNGSAANSANASNSNEEIVEITVWDKSAPDDPLKSFHEQQFAEFDKAHPNIKVTHVDATGSNGRQKFMTAVAGGEQPDVYTAAFPDMQLYIHKGIAADITDLLNNSEMKDTFIDGAFDLATKGDKIYGIPQTMYTTGLFYNKSMYEKAGIQEPPVDWDTFAQAAQKTQEANPGTIGFDILGMDWADWHFEYYVWQAGGDLTEEQPDGTVKLTFTSDAAVEALQYYHDLKWEYQVTQKNVVQDTADNQKDFYTGHSAHILGASDTYSGFVSKGMDPNDIGFAPFPKGPAGNNPSQAGGSFYIFNPKNSPAKLKASFEYAMFFMSQDMQEEALQYKKDNGFGNNPLSVVKNIDMTQYFLGMPQDVADNIQLAASNQRLEYFLKSSLSSYLVKAIQKVLLDKNADPKTELEAAQKLAQIEVIDKYNEDIKAGNSTD